MLEAEDFVKANLYENEEAVIQDALRHLVRSRPDLRLNLVLYQYEQGDISLARAAELAGVSWAQMRDILIERRIQPKLGPLDAVEAQFEVETLRRYFAKNQ
jgi:predicted HTH domain antitoxin